MKLPADPAGVAFNRQSRATLAENVSKKYDVSQYEIFVTSSALSSSFMSVATA